MPKKGHTVPPQQKANPPRWEHYDSVRLREVSEHLGRLEAKADAIAAGQAKVLTQCRAIGKILLGVLAELRGETSAAHNEAVRKDTVFSTPSQHVQKK